VPCLIPLLHLPPCCPACWSASILSLAALLCGGCVFNAGRKATRAREALTNALLNGGVGELGLVSCISFHTTPTLCASVVSGVKDGNADAAPSNLLCR